MRLVFRSLREAFLVGGVFFLGVCWAGCSSDDRPVFSMEERLQASSPEPPPVLSQPVLLLFTNQPPFGAHVRIERTPATGSGKPREGEFLHRGGRFLFAAEAPDKRGRGREMTFLWDATADRGEALNDALPGYAPLGSGLQVRTVQSTGRSAVGDKVNGHPASQETLTLTLSDGSEMQLAVWRADDLNGLPVRIRSQSGTQRFVVDLTDVRLQEPAAALFEVPQDFTRYETPKAMFEELFRRESVTRREHQTRSAYDEEEFQRTGRTRPAE